MAGGTDDNPSIELPVDSPNWLPLLEAHRLLCSLLGERNLAAKDLTDAMADDDGTRRVRSMRRCFMRGVPQSAELLLASYWIEHWLDCRRDGVFVVEGFRSIATVKGYAFFVWKPDLAEIWPTVFRPSSSSPPASIPTTTPKQSPLEEPLLDPETWLNSLQAEFDRLPRKQKSAWVRETAYPRMVRELGDRAPWDNWESLKRAMYPGRRKKI
jgi:hypothetical protein